MDIKIKPSAGTPKLHETWDEAPSRVDSVGGASAASETTADPVSRIATQLVEGRIDTTQAVDALIEQTMSMNMVAQAPESLRQEVETLLRNAIENDPYLVGLVRHLD
ncbi:MAG: hypothetical protein JXX14_08035 [Deltaproteobacteria bacterium]|nr:hypothetical protein [Deltaproteobacteria bacterium]